MKPKTKPFSKLTKAQQRVAIAEDALAQIEAKTIRVKSGNYIRLPVGMVEFKQGTQLSSSTPCQACQIGQGIICGIRLFNEDTATDNGGSAVMALRLIERWFPTKTAVMMEGAFEDGCWTSEFKAEVSDGDRESLRLFKRRHRSFKARSIGIWKNIIANKGEFIP